MGKTVVSAGKEIGMISDVEGSVAYIDPEPGQPERIMGRLGQSDKDEDDFALESDQIARMTDDGVTLVDDFYDPALPLTR